MSKDNFTKEKKIFEKEFIDKAEMRFGRGSYFVDIWNWITQVFAPSVERKLIKKVEDILENKVRVYAKINFCEECRKQPALKKNELIMYVEKDLKKEIEQLKKEI